MSKRILSLLMALALCLTLLPAAAFAEGGAGNIVSGGLMDESGEGGGVLVPPGGTTEGGGIYPRREHGQRGRRGGLGDKI